jgi:hypothetical protein
MSKTPVKNRQLGDIADSILFENDRVRIWELKMAPGTRGAVHEHELDHILIQISGDRMAVQPEPDTKGYYNEYEEADVEPGNHFYVGKGGIESAVNIGNETYHEIIVELKDPEDE